MEVLPVKKSHSIPFEDPGLKDVAFSNHHKTPTAYQTHSKSEE